MGKLLHIMSGSLRLMWRFRLRSTLTLLSAMLGVAGVVASVNYASGGRQQVLNQIRRLGTNVILVTPQQSRSAPKPAGEKTPNESPFEQAAVFDPIGDFEFRE